MASNPRDLNNNYEDGLQDVSYQMARKNVENTPKFTDDEYEKISDTDNTRTKGDRLCMSANLSGIWKGDPTHQDPADNTKGYCPIGIARVGSEDTDKGTFTEVMNIDRGKIVPLEAMRKKKGKLTTEEREAKNLEELSNGPLSILTESVKTTQRC